MTFRELTVANVAAELVSQNFIPRQNVYSHEDVGRVDVVIYNIQGGSPNPDGDVYPNDVYPGEPMVRFEAKRIGLRAMNTIEGESVRVFDSLQGALNYIGIY